MLDLLWLVPALPFAGALVLLVLGRALPRKAAAGVGIGSVAASAAIAGGIANAFLRTPPTGGAFRQYLWTWIAVDGFRPEMALYLDALSLVMILVVTFVGFLIHVYSAEFMAHDEGFSRFFGYMNLFVGSMLTLVLADNLLLLYLGWEGVGLCSYLLIGFWYQDPVNVRAGQKAFIVTRVGDTAFAVGLFILFYELGTLGIQDLMRNAQSHWAVGAAPAVAATALLLGGAVGKSAQLPLQTWLPDAMAGPTPTSALIHAATMVTAGVYLIARLHVLYDLAPGVRLAVGVVGAATLLLAGCSALVQEDIKRILAYSTISQIGYMFLALGVGAWGAAIFHFMTHAFFKALLFLAAGIAIESLHDEHSIFRMGGLRRELPVAFWTLLIGGCSLAGLPLITAGYYSKDFILWNATAVRGLYVAGIVGVVLTSLYTFRMVFVAGFGPPHTPVSRRPGWVMQAPAWILAVLAIVGGFGREAFTSFISTALPEGAGAAAGMLNEAVSGAIVGAAFLAGFLGAWFLYLFRPAVPAALYAKPLGRAVHRFWHEDWGMDWLYDRLFVRPVLWIARANRGDFIDSIYDGLALLTGWFHRVLSLTETGRLRWYAAGIAAGTALFIALAVLL